MAKTLSAPPLNLPPLDKNGQFILAWQNWFNALYQRVGAGGGLIEDGSWTPQLEGVVLIGNVSVTGKYSKIGSTLTVEVYIEPNIGSTLSNAGAKIKNLPFTAQSLGTIGVVDAQGNRLGEGSIAQGGKIATLPTWSANPNKIVISGSYRT